MSLNTNRSSSNAAEIYPQALALILQAIDLLDSIEAPSDIAAHLDRAANRISDITGRLN